jgi:hypothetical protein
MSKIIPYAARVVVGGLLLLLMSSCGGGSAQSNASQPTDPSQPGQPVVPSQAAPAFFGMQQTHYAGCDSGSLAFPLFDVPAGTFRIFGGCNTHWATMNPAANTYDFSGLDILLAALHSRGIEDTFIQLGDTPPWISSNPQDPYCDQANVDGLPTGMCEPPSDLDATPGSGLGDGTDLAWRSFITALLQHVTAPSYASTHAHIQIYSIWDEFHRSDTVNTATCALPGSGQPPCSYRGTFAQMLRMTQDLRCIVKGHSSDPITATNLTCGSSGYAASGLDPKAMIMQGDAGGFPGGNGNATMQNYLYCNANPPAGSMCNYGSAGGAATDIISGHTYFNSGVPENRMQYIAAEMAMLSAADKKKPYITGEGSWGKNERNGNPSVSNPSLQAAYVVRWYIDLLILGVSRGYWFAWDEFEPAGAGGLWSPTSVTFPPLECTTPDQAIGGFYCTGALAYKQLVNWLSGATLVSATCPGQCTSPGSGVFVVNVTRSSGYQAQVQWDSSPTSNCTNPQCGSTPMLPPPFAAAQWRDNMGNTHSGSPSAIGASPIIIENMAPPS